MDFNTMRASLTGTDIDLDTARRIAEIVAFVDDDRVTLASGARIDRLLEGQGWTAERHRYTAYYDGGLTIHIEIIDGGCHPLSLILVEDEMALDACVDLELADW